MLKSEFLKMMRQDAITGDQQIKTMLSCFEEVLKEYPDTVEIDGKKNLKECFNKMRDYARENQVDGSYFFSPQQTYDFIKNYLELKERPSGIGAIKFEDFM